MLSQVFIERLILLLIGGYITYFISLKIIEKSFSMEDGDINIIIPKDLNLNNHEKYVYGMVLKYQDITTQFKDIKGLDEVKSILNNRLIMPMKNKDLKNNKLLKSPNGVILYGNPGTGKTMLVKALCKEGKVNFINFSTNVIENKMFGESGKIVNALFTLANKLKPVIVFIDEMDGFFGKRSDLEQSFIINLKTLFYSKMDGILGLDDSIVFVGATNRLSSIDNAMLRRMRLHLHIDLPDWKTREEMFSENLKQLYPSYDYAILEEMSEGLSCCDIVEICKAIGYKSYNYKLNIFEPKNEYIMDSITEFK
jgi:SpoVK/Ycf46/Vps4 family AAA+-type ATPase